jgi:hypothetical protein
MPTQARSTEVSRRCSDCNGNLEHCHCSTSRAKNEHCPVKEPFAKVPEWLLHAVVPANRDLDKPACRLSSTAIHLFALLQRYAGDDGCCFPSRRKLATNLGCSTRTVDRCLSDLRSVRAIDIHPRYQDGKRERTSNLYVLKIGGGRHRCREVATLMTAGWRHQCRTLTIARVTRATWNESLYRSNRLNGFERNLVTDRSISR